MPVNTSYRPSSAHLALEEAFFDPVAPASFPQARLRFRNDRWASVVGLSDLTDTEWVDHFARFTPLPGTLQTPIALRYHGHQFRHYNPDIGDGRGFLFAQLIADSPVGDQLLDLATKGSGQTPYSRSGDGRLTLKGGVREILATELLEARGVTTSKSFSLIETGEALHRGDEPSPTRSAVLVRLGHSHIRFGTFQRVAFRKEKEALRRLIDYSIDTYWPDARDDADPVAAFFGFVTRAVACQAAEWFAAGFVHGVLNTDNTVITGESFDYGPWRFLPTYEPGFTAAYFDQTGLYAFARQPGALHWNLQRLADCLLPFTTEAALVDALEPFNRIFEDRLTEMALARLGLEMNPSAAADAADTIVRPLYASMYETKAGFEQTFHDLFGGADQPRLSASPQAKLYEQSGFPGVCSAIRASKVHPNATAALNQPTFQAAAPVDLLYDDVEALWSSIATDDNWQPLYDRIDAIRAYGALLGPIVPARAEAPRYIAPEARTKTPSEQD